MPILDHIEKAVAPASTGVTIPYAFNPGALNRYVLIVVNISYDPPDDPIAGSSVSFGGLTFDIYRSGNSIGEGGGAPTTRCLAYARSAPVEAPLSGDAVINLGSAANLIVYVIGFRGVSTDQFHSVWENEGVNAVPSSATVIVMNNPYVGIAGLALKDEGIITSVSGTAEIAEQETIVDGGGLLSLTGSIVMVPQGQNVTTAFFNGNAGHGRIEWVPYADMDQGIDVFPAPPVLATKKLSPYFKHEIRQRTGRSL